MSIRSGLELATVAGGLLMLGLGFVADAGARTRCSYSGTPTNRLTVSVSGFAFAEIRRNGDEIVVSELFEARKRCAGEVPTVLNTDTITVLARGDPGVALELGGGPFAPGATAEDEGAPEIEVEFRGFALLGEVVGTPRADEFHWGPGGAHAGLNLNPGSAADSDVDVTVRGESSFLVMDGARGNDTIVSAPGASIPDGVSSNGGRGDDLLNAPRNSGRVGSILHGGSGNDSITGSTEGDILGGGAGSDRVVGAGGQDEVSGGLGTDQLLGGPGRDFVRTRDSKRDWVMCGPGRDRVRADRRDRLRGCERIARE